jgi:hypothetical protein
LLRFGLPVLLLLAAFACSKPEVDTSDQVDRVGMVTFSTSLKDSLPVKTFENLGIKNVTGTKTQRLDGNEISYFEYQADVEVLISELSKSSFDIYAPVADTICHRISYQDLIANLGTGNFDLSIYPASFYQANTANIEIYECIKFPLTHHLLIERSSGKILHIIQYTA